MTRGARIGLFLAASIVTSVFFIDFCGFVYGCGCQSIWAGADSACNIHTHGVKHCPFCSIGLPGPVGVWALIVASQAGICFGVPGLGTVVRSIAAFAAFPVTGGILALVIGVFLGYWH